jgi:hypothetical protein
MATDPITTDGSGRGWPDPSEPGVPAEALHDGYHWLGDPTDGDANIAQWDPDSWSWSAGLGADLLGPEEVKHMNYLGPCRLPPGSPQTR